MNAYSARVVKHMRALYDSLSEKDRRRYAAVEAEKLGYGGVQYIANLFECDPGITSDAMLHFLGKFENDIGEIF